VPIYISEADNFTYVVVSEGLYFPFEGIEFSNISRRAKTPVTITVWNVITVGVKLPTYLDSEAGKLKQHWFIIIMEYLHVRKEYVCQIKYTWTWTD